MSKLYRASQDCIALVDQIGIKLRNVVPDYMKNVKGDINSTDLPQPVEFRQSLNTYLQVHARFSGRNFDTAQPLKGGPQRMISEREIGAIADLAQRLINLGSATEARKTGQPCTPPQLTVNANDMILPDRIMG